MFMIACRRDERDPWQAYPTLYDKLADAQESMIKMGQGSSVQFDIHYTESIVNKLLTGD